MRHTSKTFYYIFEPRDINRKNRTIERKNRQKCSTKHNLRRMGLLCHNSWSENKLNAQDTYFAFVIEFSNNTAAVGTTTSDRCGNPTTGQAHSQFYIKYNIDEGTTIGYVLLQVFWLLKYTAQLQTWDFSILFNIIRSFLMIARHFLTIYCKYGREV